MWFFLLLSFQLSAHSFEKAVADIYARKPHLKPIQEEQKKELVNEKQIKKIINCAAFSYASIKIYLAHAHLVQVQSNEQGWIAWFCPSAMQKISYKAQFFVESLIICCEALAYKTLARLLCRTYKGDLFDLPLFSYSYHDKLTQQ